MPALLLLLQEAAKGGEEAFTPFSINTGLIFWTILVYLLLFAALWRLGWPALLKSVEERERRIQEELDEAERARAQTAALLEEHKRTIAAARNEAQEWVARARGVAEKGRQTLLAQAREDSVAQLARAGKEIGADKGKPILELRRETVDLSIDEAPNQAEAKLLTDANRRLVI